MLMDFDIRVSPLVGWLDARTCFFHEDIILLLADFTRVRSLRLTGSCCTVHLIVDSLRRSLPVQSLSLRLRDIGRRYVIPEDLFGGKAPIRRLQLVRNAHIVAPHWLLRGVTHFTSGELIALPELLDVLRQMSALAYFEFQHGRLCWMQPDVGKLRASPIQMPQLMNLIVWTNYLDEFILLNQLLLLHVGAKRRLELPASAFRSWFFDVYCIDVLSPVVEAANGFQHIYFSATQKEG